VATKNKKKKTKKIKTGLFGARALSSAKCRQKGSSLAADLGKKRLSAATWGISIRDKVLNKCFLLIPP